MELLKLLFFSTSYYFLGYHNFIILLLSTLIIKISASTKIDFNVNNFDPVMFCINIINIITKLVRLQLNISVTNMNNTYFGSKIIKGYNYLNSQYINIRSYPFRLLFNSGTNTVKPQLNNTNEINNFLDSLN
jgi:hypothetical protein